MEAKVLLIDANGVEIGETYSRRARQLVKQQRAIWADDSHTAIKFAPDHEEEWEQPQEELPVSRLEKSPEALYILAEKRIRDRKRMIIHTLLLIPGYIAFTIFWNIMTDGRMHHMSFLTLGIAWGMWTMYFITQLRAFIKNYSVNIPRDWESRRRIKLEAEIDRLKRMGYRE